MAARAAVWALALSCSTGPGATPETAIVVGVESEPLGGAIHSTCINGACASDMVAPQALEPYSPSWAPNIPDICKPLHAGPPVVQVGTGQTDYVPFTTGQTVQMEAGPQGGHHIWIATRQENLKQAGTMTTITSTQPWTGVTGPLMRFVFNFEQDQGGSASCTGFATSSTSTGRTTTSSSAGPST